MILIVEFIIIFILITSLVLLLSEERRVKKSKIPKGTVKEYWNGRERRQTRRINTSLIVKYNIEKKPNLKSSAHMNDLSIGGMGIFVNEKLNEGVLLLLEFELPDLKNAVCIVGKVVWAQGDFGERDETGKRIFKTGIQFVSIRPDDENRLGAYIEKNSEAT